MELVKPEKSQMFPSFLDSLAFRFEDIPRVLRRIFDVALEEHDLSRSQWRLLAYVLRDEGMTQTELARSLELERASVGQAIDTLERKKLVERVKSSGDRRVWHIHATEAGRRLIPELREMINEIHQQIFAGFSDEEISQLGRFLDRIMTNLEN